MKVVIDMQGAQSIASKNRGVGRTCFGLVDALLKTTSDKHEYYLACNGVFPEGFHEVREHFKQYIPESNIKCWQQPDCDISGLTGSKPMSEAVQYIREWYINQLQADVVWSVNLQEGWIDSGVTSVKKIDSGAVYCNHVHDVIPLLYPNELLNDTIQPWYDEKINFATKSDYIFTVSDYSRTKISELLGFELSNIEVIYNDANKKVFHTEQSETSQKEMLSLFGVTNDSYILFVGGGDKHKNIDVLLKAYASLSISLRKQYPLVIAGSQFVNHESIRNELFAHADELKIARESIITLGEVSDAELRGLYQGCALYVFPSISEGFGIPPLEAMACGAAVVTSNAASLPEVMGDDEFQFDPYDHHELATLITKTLTDNKFKARLKSHGKNRVKEFSWEQSAHKVLEFFQKIENDAEQRNLISNTKNYELLCKGVSSVEGLSEEQLMLIAQCISDNVINESKKVFLDISSLVHFDHATGIQRVVRAICDVLIDSNVKNVSFEPVFSFAGNDNFYYPNVEDGKFSVPSHDHLDSQIVDFSDGDVLIFLDLHPSNGFTKRELIKRLKIRSVRSYFVVYDLLPIYYPDYFVPELVLEFEQWLTTVACSDGALCISEDVANKFQAWAEGEKLSLPNDFECKYFHLGANLDDSAPSKGIPVYADDLTKACENRKSFLMVGTVEPRKGHALSLDAFERLWEKGEDVVLIIVGKPGWRNEATINRLRNHEELNSRLFWLDGISDEFLDIVYRQADCLIAASEGEGFGLPLIEAAQYKTPMIIRDIPVFREVAGEHAYYFSEVNDPAYLVNAIVSWCKLYENNQHPKSDDMPWLTWKESSLQLLNCIGIE
ncbi:glycosyltransferase family 4 protein [Vibrio sp. 10N.261.51.A4]|uniref:glycosyltransferase family 4 protein n=1 Tax=Vibrio sp. 10N.261.51.A4 TaxID=3229674 RepID=UPI0035513222